MGQKENVRPRIWRPLWLVAAVLCASTSWADTILGIDFEATTLADAQQIYSYVPSLMTGPRAFVTEQLYSMRVVADQIRWRNQLTHEVASEPILRVSQVAERPSGLLGLSADPTAAGSFGAPGHGISTDAMGELVANLNKEMIAELAELPELAVTMADRLINLTDTALAMLLNLRGLLQNEVSIDWKKLLHSERLVVERKRVIARRAAIADEEKEPDPSGVRRAVRSVFKICMGICIGFGIWLFVRRL